MEKFEAQYTLEGQAKIWEYLLTIVDSMALKCAVELRIPDIINSHGHPITLSQIAVGINSTTPPDMSHLERILRFLVRKKIFSIAASSNGETLYGLTPASVWLVHGTELSLAPMIVGNTHQNCLIPMFQQLSACVKEGGIPFKKAHGLDFWDFASGNPEFSQTFNNGMGCTAKIVTRAIISGYKDGFDSIGSLVDVGGGTGKLTHEIVKAYPHIKGTNFDQPHVVATAPEYDGVVHVGGDMFKEVPRAQAILMKWILHDWSDEDCVKILKNCRKALPDKTGKLIIVENILQPEGEDLFDSTSLGFDLLMLTFTSGKERTELEWKVLLNNGGFPRYKIVNISAFWSLIEAYPN